MLQRKKLAKNKKAMLYALVSSTLLFPMPGSSYAAEENPQFSLDTVVVTAARAKAKHDYVAATGTGRTGSKTGAPLTETPQIVNVVTRQEMNDLGVYDLQQALRYTGGVASEVYGTDTRVQAMYVRGFRAPNYLDGLNLYNGFAQGYTTPLIEAYGIERVEVLKGPASVLYGQNVPGGLFNMISKKPTTESIREIQLQTGSFDRLQGAFDFSGPVDADKTRLFRLTGLMRDSGTQTDFTDNKRTFLAPGFTWRFDDDTSLTVLAQYLKDSAGATYQAMPMYGTLMPNPHGSIPRSRLLGEPGYDSIEREQFSIGYELEHKLDATWTLRQNLRYNKVDFDGRMVYATGFVPGSDRLLNRATWQMREQGDIFAIDNQAQAIFNTGRVRHTLLLGADYRRAWYDAKFGYAAGTASALDVYAPVYGQGAADPPTVISTTQIREQFGLYLQDQLKAGRWVLTLGGRQDWVDTDAVTNTSPARRKDDAFSKRIGLTYLNDNGLAPYVSYSTSFEPTSGADRLGNAFVPTTGQQYEVGVKYQPQGSKSMVTLSGFNLKQQNVLTPDTVQTSFSVQEGEARVRGVELEVKTSLSNNLSLTASYAYMESEVTKANPNAAGTSNIGKRLPFVPQNQASLWANYTLPAGRLDGLSVGAGIRYIGPSYGTASNTTAYQGQTVSSRVPGYTLVDAGVQYDFGKKNPRLAGVSMAINVSNLFDKQYVASCLGEYNTFYGNGRTVLATLKYQW
ncbi:MULTISPECIES: TonB-dependent siderophore receptor [Sporomusa]|uniref:TonB-dependent siderophore receptor n=1 Tax=Sporomusa TaxID=2375 RepID=UPI0031590D4E